MFPFIPLARPQLGEAAITAAVRVLRSSHLAQGAEVAAFEDEFSALVDGRHCVAVNSGTTALWLALAAAGISPGDEVITTAFTFGATAAAIRLTGATVVFADIDPVTLCLDPTAAAAAITPRTAAILPVHLYGHPAAMDAFQTLATRHGLLLVEDAAQAHTAALRGRPAGALGDVAAFSLYATKNMTTIEGGIITTADPSIARTARLLRNQGSASPYDYERVGINGRMNDVTAAIGRVELTTLAGRTAARRRNAHRLTAGLAALPGLHLPTQQRGARHVYHQYAIRVRAGDGVRGALRDTMRHAGIDTAIHYPIPLHRSTAYQADVELPHTDRAAAQMLSLPVHPGVAAADLDRIVAEAAAALADTSLAGALGKAS